MKQRILFYVVLGLLLNGCGPAQITGWLKNPLPTRQAPVLNPSNPVPVPSNSVPVLSNSVPVLSNPVPVLSNPVPALNSPSIQQEINLALQREKYREALKLLREEEERGLAPQRFGDAWPQALNGLLSLAEHQRQIEEYGAAGVLYQETIMYFPKNSALAQAVALDPVQLTLRRNDCADHLLTLGLLAYRQGALQDAIAIWSKIGDFHPQHEASQRALTTTRRQLQNLEAIFTQ